VDVGPGGADPAAWQLRDVAVTHPDAVALVAEVQQEYVARYGSPDETPVVPEHFVAPGGLFVVGYLGGDPVATGAWRRTTVPLAGATRVAEVKRMYVVPRARHRGLARAVLAHLEQTAADAGVDGLLLETGTKQPEAIALYGSSGYVPVPGYGHYQGSPLSRCFGKLLQKTDKSHVAS